MANAVGVSNPVNQLEQFFLQADNDLEAVRRKLEIELEEDYPDKANPLKLLKRIKAIQQELPSLMNQCKKLLVAKQDLIDRTQSMLVGNRASIQRMQSYLNIPSDNNAADTVYSSFQEVINEWNQQLGLRASHISDEETAHVLNDVNRTLFSSKMTEN
eukprot:TRINITY_DN23522_c0_g1_i3.p1 TRINITY_DN23522_c0_g1~~TRINITY_DN23522_c0_g1_i3.p1  ORF type:complete len:165 (-),score=35.28 TRINITY_DN23522_c0_g1_i3:198-671(-)